MMQHTVQALQSELDNLRADNIKLYEKIKFLQSYPGRVSGCPSICPAGGFAQTDPKHGLFPAVRKSRGKAHVTCVPLTLGSWGQLERGRMQRYT